MFNDDGGVGTTSSVSVRRARSRRGTFAGGFAALSRAFRAADARVVARAAGFALRMIGFFAACFRTLGRLVERRAAAFFRPLTADDRALPAFRLAISPLLSEPLQFTDKCRTL